jgi:NMD protein affecting ribosome stability and mRNA decay
MVEKIYHMTYSVRILTYKTGDVIKTKEGEMIIIDINKKFVKLQDVKNKIYKQITIQELLNNDILLIE